MRSYERLSSSSSEETNKKSFSSDKDNILEPFVSEEGTSLVDQQHHHQQGNTDTTTTMETTPHSTSRIPSLNEDTRLSSSSESMPIQSSSSATAPSSNRSEQRDLEDLESQTPPRLTTKQRIQRVLHHFFPVRQTYERINNGLTTGRMQTNNGRFIGQGTDGVFRNLMAKPDTEEMRQQQELNPPSYEEAAADASPEYWESTMISPMYEDEVFVQGLPVGNIANFVWNALVSVAFQFVGFILCYLLHTSHAAKQGSRAGLGINLIMYGWNLVPQNFGHPDKLPKKYQPENPNDFDINKSTKISGKVDGYNSGIFIQNSNADTKDSNGGDWLGGSGSAPYVAYGLIAFGLFIILKSLVDYYRVKQLERAILNPPSNMPVNTNSITGVVDEIDEENRHREQQQQQHQHQEEEELYSHQHRNHDDH
ncbi:Metal homeostatis protein bsd2 [Candida albicans]